MISLCEECRTTFWGRNEDRLPKTVLTLKPCLRRGFFLASPIVGLPTIRVQKPAIQKLAIKKPVPVGTG